MVEKIIEFIKGMIRFFNLVVLPLFILAMLYRACDYDVKSFIICILFFVAMIVVVQLSIWAWSDY